VPAEQTCSSINTPKTLAKRKEPTRLTSSTPRSWARLIYLYKLQSCLFAMRIEWEIGFRAFRQG
jgi:hypothetical protein